LEPNSFRGTSKHCPNRSTASSCWLYNFSNKGGRCRCLEPGFASSHISPQFLPVVPRASQRVCKREPRCGPFPPAEPRCGARSADHSKQTEIRTPRELCCTYLPVRSSRHSSRLSLVGLIGCRPHCPCQPRFRLARHKPGLIC
jgi:hypothetical protein